MQSLQTILQSVEFVNKLKHVRDLLKYGSKDLRDLDVFRH